MSDVGPMEKQGPVRSVVPGVEPASLREILILSYPIVVSMGSQALMGVADTFFLGWSEKLGAGGVVVAGTAQQAGVGLGAVLAWTLMSFMTGAMTGLTPFVAQNRGGGNPRVCGVFAWQAIYLAVPFALVSVGLGAASGRMIHFAGADSAIQPFAARYLAVRLYGGAPLFLNFALVSFFRGIGDTKTPMWVSLGANAVNVLLNYVFIFGRFGLPPMGVTGAALATIFSTALSGIVYFRLFFSRHLRGQYGTARGWRFDGTRFGKLVRVGLPIGGNWLLENGSWSFFTVLVSRIGKTEMAAHTVVLQTMHMAFLPSVAMLIGVTTLVGHYLGAGRSDIAERAAARTLRLALGYAGTMATLFVLARGHLMLLFNRDPAVVAVGENLVWFMSAFVVLDAFYLVIVGVLRGSGDVRWPLWVTAGSAWLVFIPSVWIFANVLDLGVYGAWMGLLVHGAVLALAFVYRFRKGRWKQMSSLVEWPAEMEVAGPLAPLP